MTAPALDVRNLSKTFAATRALDRVSLTVEPGEIHGLLGENGSGKSTLIKVLSGFHRPDAHSEIRIGGISLEPGSPSASYRLGCRFVHQDLGLVETASVLDNLALGVGFPSRAGTIRTREALRRARRALEHAGLDLDPNMEVASLAPAIKTGVAVARALDPAAGSLVRLLVLDEPTATLPETEVARLMSIVRTVAGQGVGVVYVTHRLEEVFALTDRATVLRDGRNVATRDSAGLSRDELVTLLVGGELADAREESVGAHVERDQVVLEVRGLHAPPLRDVDLTIRAGELVGIAGLTGSGRDQLLSAIFGRIPRRGGSVCASTVAVRPGNVPDALAAGLAFLPADRREHAAIMGLSGRENLTLADLRPLRWMALIRRRAERAEVGRWWRRLSIRPAHAAEQPLFTLSGGNQQKVMFARWLRRDPAVLMLDEPTQGVDVGAKAELHHQLVAAAGRGAAVVLSSSDADEIAALCHRVLVFVAGHVAVELRGDQITAAAISRAALGGLKEVA